MASPNLMYRPYNDEDISFITNSWLKSMQKSLPWSNLKNTIYFSGMAKRINHIIDRAGVLVACDPRSPDTIVGWMCAEWIDLDGEKEPVMHYVYVKYPFRGFGIYTAFYDRMAQDGTFVPWATFKPLVPRKFDHNFTGRANNREFKVFGKNTLVLPMERLKPDHLHELEFNPFLLDTLDAMVTFPCAHKTTL